MNSSYERYLKSPEWQEVRRLALERNSYRCQGCGSDGSDSRLEVHHLTYQRIGHEHPNDLMVLCNHCHALEHGKPPIALPVAGPNDDELTRRVREVEDLPVVHERYVRSLGLRLKQALRVGDRQELRAIHSEMGDLIERWKREGGRMIPSAACARLCPARQRANISAPVMSLGQGRSPLL